MENLHRKAWKLLTLCNVFIHKDHGGKQLYIKRAKVFMHLVTFGKNFLLKRAVSIAVFTQT